MFGERLHLRRGFAVMAVDAPTSQGSGFALLAEACLRNQSAEVHWAATDGQARRERARLLRIKGERLLMDGLDLGLNSPLATPGIALSVSFSVARGQRLGFRTRGRGPERFRLNPYVTVRALAVDLPDVVEDHQRREHYRVSVAGREPIPVRFENIDANPDETVDEPRLANMVNLSQGGTAVLLPVDEHPRPSVGERFEIAFKLPEDLEPYAFTVEVRHVREMRGQDRVVLGVQFVSGRDRREFDHGMDRLGRFVIVRQREMLRRAR